MEISTFSDMLLVEPYLHISKKNHMIQKKIGFFDDKMLYKTIGDLKTNLNKKKNLIENYNPPNTSKKTPLTSENDNYLSEGRELNHIESKLNTEERRVKNNKIKFSLLNSRNKEMKAISMNKYYLNSNKKVIMNATTISNNSKTNNRNSEIIDNKIFQVIKPKNKNNSKFDEKIKKTEIENIFKNGNPNLIKNQIISGRLNKGSNQDNMPSDRLSVKNTLNSKMFDQKIEDSDKKSKDDINIFRRNSSVELDQESMRFYLNKDNNLAKYNASIGKEVVDSKIDFVYKKIFDKKSRYLFSKTENDDNSSQAKRKLKSNLEQENEYTKILGSFKQKQYIEDKIQDIKRKIFFIKGVYDFSYPQIIVNKIKTAQDFYNSNHAEEKARLRDPLNHTSKKFLAIKEEKLKLQNEEFRKTFNIERMETASHNIITDRFENENKLYPDIEQKMLRSSSSINFKPLKNARLTLTNKFIYPEEINKVRVVTPINIQTVRPDLGGPSKLKVIHKSKIL